MAATKFSHPPAVALTIFSYLSYSDISFVLSSAVALCIVVLTCTSANAC